MTAKSAVGLGTGFTLVLLLTGVFGLLPWQTIWFLVLAGLAIALLSGLRIPHRASGETPAISSTKAVARAQAVAKPAVFSFSQQSVALEKRAEPKPPGLPQGETRTIPTESYISYEVALAEGDELQGEVSTDGIVNVYLLTGENLACLENGEEFWYDAGEKGVSQASIHFTASEKGKRVFIVENADDRVVSANLKVVVEPSP